MISKENKERVKEEEEEEKMSSPSPFSLFDLSLLLRSPPLIFFFSAQGHGIALGDDRHLFSSPSPSVCVCIDTSDRKCD
jgi:hypothetical protein